MRADTSQGRVELRPAEFEPSSHAPAGKPGKRIWSTLGKHYPTALAVAMVGVDLNIPFKAANAVPVSTMASEVLATKETGTCVLKPFPPKAKTSNSGAPHPSLHHSRPCAIRPQSSYGRSARYIRAHRGLPPRALGARSCLEHVLPFAKAVSRSRVKYYWTGVILRYALQTFILLPQSSGPGAIWILDPPTSVRCSTYFAPPVPHYSPTFAYLIKPCE
jgi:hypothetical protein